MEATPPIRWPHEHPIGQAVERLVFAGAVAVTVGSLFLPKLLPCVDYPQHLALADVARRLLSPGAPEHALFELNLFTYYGLVHLVLAVLALAMPIEIAGKLVLGGALVLMAASVRHLLRELGRPPVYAALFVPMLFSFSVSWGFLNYVVALAVAFATLGSVARAMKAPPDRRAAVRLAVASLVCAMTHPLAMLVLWLFSAPMAFELALRGAGRVVPALRRTVVGLAPTALGGAWCAIVYFGHTRGSQVRDTHEIVFWPKLLRFSVFATDLHADRTDADVLYATLEVMGAIAVAGLALALIRRARADRAQQGVLLLPFATMLAGYLAMPMVFMGSQLMFPRLVPALVLSALLALPRLVLPLAELATAASLAMACWSAANLSAHLRQYGEETGDATRLLDDLPPGRRASALIFRDFTDAFWRGGLLHLAAYYAARKHGDWAYSFARYEYMPVRYRPGAAPQWPEHGWEFNPADYDPRSPYARTYDLLLIKTPETEPVPEEGPLRARIFGPDAAIPLLLSHRGLYWAFDTAPLTSRLGSQELTAGEKPATRP
jgi:hypothetical protein